eukprot:CAMPEP_0172507914 /NCGR_PEP_ID=MMETSP1066-20121228/207623_1 /TAXON_ID=671091 /ORGANISM="Coscinodiscus wailesii, Strain CCMP2513" /LENGTH=100 /DNA_ID=CAMNT_0013285647 /DNA_START=88 /DNA_END=387 /DNA_ORIENTATION=+
MDFSEIPKTPYIPNSPARRRHGTATRNENAGLVKNLVPDDFPVPDPSLAFHQFDVPPTSSELKRAERLRDEIERIYPRSKRLDKDCLLSNVSETADGEWV